jgi:hypothetical protein
MNEDTELHKRIAALERRQAALERLLGLADGDVILRYTVDPGVDPAEARRFWRAVEAHVAETTPEILAPHDPDAS